MFHKYNSLISEPSYRRLPDPVLLTLITWDVLARKGKIKENAAFNGRLPQYDRLDRRISHGLTITLEMATTWQIC